MTSSINAYMYPINVAIADDNSIFRKGLANVLHGHSQIVVSAEAANGKELIDLVYRQAPDVVIMDIEMPVMNGIEATSILSSQFPDISTVALSMYDDQSLVEKMLRVGAKGFLLKNEDRDVIIAAIKTAYQKKMYCNNTILNLFTGYQHGEFFAEHEYTFSDKERSIMKLICKEYSSKEIADKLNVSVRSVEHTKEKIQNKIGAKNMVGIALYAVKKMIFSLKDLP